MISFFKANTALGYLFTNRRICWESFESFESFRSFTATRCARRNLSLHFPSHKLTITHTSPFVYFNLFKTIVTSIGLLKSIIYSTLSRWNGRIGRSSLRHSPWPQQAAYHAWRSELWSILNLTILQQYSVLPFHPIRKPESEFILPYKVQVRRQVGPVDLASDPPRARLCWISRNIHTQSSVLDIIYTAQIYFYSISSPWVSFRIGYGLSEGFSKAMTTRKL